MGGRRGTISGRGEGTRIGITKSAVEVTWWPEVSQNKKGGGKYEKARKKPGNTRRHILVKPDKQSNEINGNGKISPLGVSTSERGERNPVKNLRVRKEG